MKEISADNFGEYIAAAKANELCRVYPMSVAERIQKGYIYTDDGGEAVLFRHKNNFAFMVGSPERSFLDEVHELIMNEGLKFITADDSISRYMAELGGIAGYPRTFYSYPDGASPEAKLPDGYTVRLIDRELFSRITGFVVPSYYWWSAEDFVKNGHGVCIMKGDEPASWAFSSAVSSEEMDIGIETAEKYRHCGLAEAAAAQMIKTMPQDKRPVWTCQTDNRGSARIAEKAGFVRRCESVLLRKAEFTP